jgi:hypothetical protein
MMNATSGGELDTALENFAAELAEAAYPIVLRHGPAESWLDLQLELWRTMRQAVSKWAQDWPQAGVILVSPISNECDSHDYPFTPAR